MTERRSLVDGLAATPQALRKERDFVYGDSPAPSAQQPPPSLSRSPLTTRIRDDYAKALKRASLERQLSGTTPNTLQDILEEAIEPWLRSNGYLSQ